MRYVFLLLNLFALSAHAASPVSAPEPYLSTDPSFVESCPLKFLKRTDFAEGGIGSYCECPADHFVIIDRSEGGNGPTCLEERLTQ